ncbi:MAG: Na/Pi cotransporter family protein [Eubacteriaceae bacterium]|nr:Na/Pi cotransporter family protein [Eubacteriaceae bacterium]
MSLTDFFMLAGGLGMFFMGMNMMSDGLNRVAGERLKSFLDKITNNPIKGVLVGTVVTMIIQSSSATTVMVVGLVNAGLMNVYQASGVMLGAAIGTTITAQLIALDLSEIAPLILGIGVIYPMFSKATKSRLLGDALAGFGLLFLGISTMSSTLKPLAQMPWFSEMLVSLGSNPVMGLIVGALFTAIIQSSSAAIGILQALAMGGAFASFGTESTLGITIPILLGMNIGTCITAVISSVGTNTDAKRAATVHLLFKVIGAAWFLTLVICLNKFVGDDNILYNTIISVSGTTVIDGMVVANVSKQIANTHMFFNMVNAVILLPFMKQVCMFAEKLVKEKEQPAGLSVGLDLRMLDNPSIAIEEALKAAKTMANMSYESMQIANKCFMNYDNKLFEEVTKRENDINIYDSEITSFIVKLTKLQLSSKESEFLYRLHQLVHNVERYADMQLHIIELAKEKAEKGITFSDVAIAEINAIFAKVDEILRLALSSLETGDRYAATQAKALEDTVDEMQTKARRGHISRMSQQLCTPEQGVIFLEYISDMERLSDYGYRICQFVKFNM